MSQETHYIKVTVKAGGKTDSVTEKSGRYLITTREPAENGRANRAALALLAKYLGISENRLALIRGADKPSKLFIKR